MWAQKWGLGCATCCLLSQLIVPMAQALEILAPTQRNISSTKFGRYFGAQICEPVQGYVTTLIGEDKLCGPPFENDYTGLIVMVPDFVYSLEQLTFDSGESFPWYTSGCTKEEMFEKVVASGAIGAISIALDPLPSVGEFFHGAAKHEPTIYGKIPFAAVHIVPVMQYLIGPLSEGKFVQVRLDCDHGALGNPMIPYLEVVSVLTLVCGFMSIVLALFGLYGVAQMTGCCCCCYSVLPVLGSEKQSREPKIKKSRAVRNGIIGQAAVLCLYSVLELFVGICHVIGMGWSANHSYVLGDEVVSFSAKMIASTGFAGLKMFAIFVVALYWQEMSLSLRLLRAPRNIFRARPLVILAGLFVFTIPDFVLTGRSASYIATNSDIGLVIYTTLTIVVALFFLYSVSSLVNQLHGHITSMMTEGVVQSQSHLQLERFVFHLASYLRVFAACAFLTVVTLLVFLPTGLYFEGPAGAIAFQSLLLVLALVSSFSIIRGLRGPTRTKASGSHAVTEQESKKQRSQRTSKSYVKTEVQMSEAESEAMRQMATLSESDLEAAVVAA